VKGRRPKWHPSPIAGLFKGLNGADPRLLAGSCREIKKLIFHDKYDTSKDFVESI
jgi:hypothetical protein